jgi:hypothetical protein
MIDLSINYKSSYWHNMWTRMYMYICREFENGRKADIGQTMFSYIVHSAVKSLFGEVCSIYQQMTIYS